MPLVAGSITGGQRDRRTAGGKEGKMGGVNRCSFHCNLARFRGLMSRGKYGAVIGRILYAPNINFQAMG